MRWRNGIPPLALAMGLVASCTSVPNGGLIGGNPLGGTPLGTPTPESTPTLSPSPGDLELKPSRIAGATLDLEGVGQDRHTESIFPLTRDADRRFGNGLFYFTISNGKARVVGINLENEGQRIYFQKSGTSYWSLKAAPLQGYASPEPDGTSHLDLETGGTYCFKADYKGGTYFGVFFVRHVLSDLISIDFKAQLVPGESNLTPSAPGFRDANPDEVAIPPSPAPTPTPTPTPEPTPTPTQPPTITLYGTGTSPTQVFSVRGGLTKFNIRHVGNSYSDFELYTAKGKFRENLSWGYTSFHSDRGLQLDPGDYVINVESLGIWRIEVDQLPIISEAPAIWKFSGSHSGLAGPFRIGAGLRTVTMKYDGDLVFSVELMDSSGKFQDLLVQSFSSYSGSRATFFEDKTYYFDVKAHDASWSIEISP